MLRTVLNTSRQFVERGAQICEYLSWLILLIWVALMTVGVIMRYVFSSPLIFQVDVVSGLLVVFCSLSFTSVLLREQHIRVDILTRHLNARLQAYLLALSYLITVVFSGLMIWGSSNLIHISFRLGSRFDVSGIPIWPFQAAFIFGFVLLGCASLVRFLEIILSPADKREVRS